MRIVQFESPQAGRRVGVVQDDTVYDVTSVEPEMQRTVDLFDASQAVSRSLSELAQHLAESPTADQLSYDELWAAEPGGAQPFLRPPLDAPDPHRLLISGTGLTHTGGGASRDKMHTAGNDDAPKTDSMKMFDWGMEGGKPAPGERGVAPEWFYKGNGHNLRGHRQSLQLPAFALDGGEEPELVGCYLIDPDGRPRRLGFALANEWSDHATEKLNYLYLAPSKLRQCAVGPELTTDHDFAEIHLRCTVARNGEVIYDSGELLSGEEHMCHSLANCEDHHFKYPQHRVPGDVHLHFFGTSKLSHSTRDWKYQAGDVVRIDAPGFSSSLENTIEAGPDEDERVTEVLPA